MAKLPDENALGGLPGLSISHHLPSADMGAVGRGYQGLAHGLEEMSANIKGYFADQDALTANESQTRVSIGKEKAYYDALKNPDFEKAPEEFKTKSLAIMDAELAKVQNPKLKAKLRNDSLQEIEHKYNALDLNRFKLGNQARETKNDEMFNERIGYAMLSGDKEALQEAKREIAGTVASESLVMKRTAKQHRTRLRKWLETADAAFYGNLIATDPDRAIQELEQFKPGPPDDDDETGGPLPASLTSGKGKTSGITGWTRSDPTWAKLDPYQKAAAMSMMEAGIKNTGDAKNALGSMLNRASKEGEDLGVHVSRSIYQPTIESSQQARLGQILNSPQFEELTTWAKQRAAGDVPDPVNGATHFLAHEKTMLALEAKEPSKYRTWRQWTGFDPATRLYSGVITRDSSHAFLAPEGGYSAAGVKTAQADSGTATDASIEQSAKSKSPGVYLSPDGVSTLSPLVWLKLQEKAKLAKKSQEQQAKQEFELLQKERTQNADLEEEKMISRWMLRDRDKNPPTYEEVGDSKVLLGPHKRRMEELLSKPRDGDEGPLFQEAWERAGLVPGDPRHIDREELWDMVNKKQLTTKGYETIIRNQRDRQDPNKKEDNKAIDLFWELAKERIAVPIGGEAFQGTPGSKDPRAKELYLSYFLKAKEELYSELKRGVPLDQLLNPKSEGYIGRYIDNYRRPLDTVNKERFAPGGIAAPPKADPLSGPKTAPKREYDYSKPDDLKAAVKDRVISREEGERIAVEQGFIPPKVQAPTVPTSR